MAVASLRSRSITLTTFPFSEQVAGVFDNMVSRSVPQYGEIQRNVAVK